jgi:hypothetical protein
MNFVFTSTKHKSIVIFIIAQTDLLLPDFVILLCGGLFSLMTKCSRL